MPPDPSPTPEPEKASNVADRPHWWTLALSILAIGISIGSAIFSYLSLRESRESRKINEATSRAYLKVASLVLGTRTVYPHPDARFKYATGFITVTNTGRTAAKRVRIEQALLSSNPLEPHTRVDGGIAPVAALTELPPGASETIQLKVPVLIKNGRIDRTERQFTLDITMIYNDGIHDGDKLDDAVFCAVKPEKLMPDLVRFYYCVDTASEVHEDKKR